jgi:hypothetical protein
LAQNGVDVLFAAGPTCAAVCGEKDTCRRPMRLPADTRIAPEKLSDYMLRLREDHDKSGFPALAGYTEKDAVRLEADIRSQLLPIEAIPAGEDKYGWKYIISGTLTGSNGRSLPVRSVWMLEKATGLTKFITLYSDK